MALPYHSGMSKATENLTSAVHGVLNRLPTGVRRRITQHYFRFSRALTLGVRALVLSEAGEVLLIRHTYQPGWMLPGGGVEKGEAAEQALAHELRDEVAIHLKARPALFGIYDNRVVFPNDHVLLYVLRPGDYERLPWRPNAEIAEMGFFAPDALPEATTQGTRRRIAEVLRGLPPAQQW